jgi:hypothetical protein
MTSDAGIHKPQLGAIFVDLDAAEGAVEELRQSGLADQHLGVAVHEPDEHVFEEEIGKEMAHGLEKGIAIGAPIGAIAGMTVLSLVLPGVGTIGVGGILAAGGMTGALAGGFWGASLGVKAEERRMEEERDWERTPLQAGEVMVVVDQHGHPDTVKEILQRHGGRMVAKPAYLG